MNLGNSFLIARLEDTHARSSEIDAELCLLAATEIKDLSGQVSVYRGKILQAIAVLSNVVANDPFNQAAQVALDNLSGCFVWTGEEDLNSSDTYLEQLKFNFDQLE